MKTLWFYLFFLVAFSSVLSCSSTTGNNTTGDSPVITVSANTAISRIVTIASSTAGDSVYYTIDGSDPTQSSTLYSSGFTVAGYGVTKTIKAVELHNGTLSSVTTSAASITGTLSPAISISGLVDTVVSTGLSEPLGITSDGSNIYFIDSNHYQIKVLSSGSVSVFAGSGSSSLEDGIGTAASFLRPVGIATDGIYLYVTDSCTIRKVVISTGAVTTLAGSATRGTGNGIGSYAYFGIPYGITTDGTNVYVADGDNNNIRQINISSATVTTLADGFNDPYGITTDGTNLYLADTGNNEVKQIVISTGEVTTLAGSTTQGTGNGVGSAASFTYPNSIYCLGGILYVQDTNEIRKITISSKLVASFVGAVDSGNSPGTGSNSRFNRPDGITTNGTYLYVCDYNNNSVRRIQ
jgi:hypothetical protein